MCHGLTFSGANVRQIPTNLIDFMGLICKQALVRENEQKKMFHQISDTWLKICFCFFKILFLLVWLVKSDFKLKVLDKTDSQNTNGKPAVKTKMTFPPWSGLKNSIN